mmetsp:Transcript_25203/g.38496  ORF Transcript_25203/g.38496 Transcript_25203/m.38496 type:complete len:121 (-) Transcript_25203:589-951(-)
MASSHDLPDLLLADFTLSHLPKAVSNIIAFTLDCSGPIRFYVLHFCSSTTLKMTYSFLANTYIHPAFVHSSVVFPVPDVDTAISSVAAHVAIAVAARSTAADYAATAVPEYIVGGGSATF